MTHRHAPRGTDGKRNYSYADAKQYRVSDVIEQLRINQMLPNLYIGDNKRNKQRADGQYYQ